MFNLIFDHLALHALIVAELEDLPHLGDKKESEEFANTFNTNFNLLKMIRWSNLHMGSGEIGRDI